jgi:hypothetical protein
MTPLSIPQLRSESDTRAKHARNCKKPIDACPLCKASIAWFRDLAPEVLAHVLADYGKPANKGAY